MLSVATGKVAFDTNNYKNLCKIDTKMIDFILRSLTF